jgi:hypothetical protein
MAYRKLLLNVFVAASLMSLAPVAATGDVPCFTCQESCPSGVEVCYAFEKCKADQCEATMEQKVCSYVD